MSRRALTVAGAAGIGLLVYSTVIRLSPGSKPSIQEGAAAPAFRLTDVAGQSATLSQYRGRVVLLDFWATWCDTCLEDLQDLKKLHRKYRDKGLEILAPACDDGGRRILLPFIARHAIPWRVLLADTQATRLYRVFGLPAKFLIDPQGLLSRRYDGPVDRRDLETQIRRLLRLPPEGDT